MSVDWEKSAKAYWDEQPHPRGHGLKIKEVATAVKLASMMKFGGHAEMHEAALFWQEFAPGGVPLMPPEEFERVVDRVAPLSFTFHGRPPSMKEIADLASKASHEVRKYFADLPDKLHPEITAGEMVKSFQAARPWARQHLEREPVHTESAYLHHSGEKPDAYYARLGAQNTEEQADALHTSVGGDSGEGGVGVAGRQAPDQRTPHR
jgi:hypothetical protein